MNSTPETTRHRKLIEGAGKLVSSCVMLVGAVVILLVAAELASGGALRLLQLMQAPPQKTPGVDPRASLPVYHNAAADRRFVMDDVKVHFEPYYHWRRDEIASEYVNVDARGVRRTIKAPEPGARRVFVFGGSTVWGTGVADAYTIPSLLQRRLGARYDVYNYGETAFVSVQELSLLLKELAGGNVPDAVIFYHGFNDTYAGVYSPALPRDPQNERSRQLNLRKPFHQQVISRTSMYQLYERARLGAPEPQKRDSRWDKDVSPRVAENSRGTLEAWEQFVFQAKAVAKAYGFNVFFFWQPHLLSGTRRTQPYEEAIIASCSPVLVEAMRQVYRDAKPRLSGREHEEIYFLGNVFDDFNEPTYTDWVHLGPNGNEVVAEEIFKRLRGRL